MRFMNFILLLCLALFAPHSSPASLDGLLLRTQAAVFPKVLLLDRDLQSKLNADHVTITILHQASERNNAENFKNLIAEKYHDRLGAYKLSIKLVDYQEFSTDYLSTAYVMLPAPADIQSTITSYSAGNHRVCFSYSYKDLENEALVSLLMKEKMYIYLNKRVLSSYGVRFVPSFYKIVKMVE